MSSVQHSQPLSTILPCAETLVWTAKGWAGGFEEGTYQQFHDYVHTASEFEVLMLYCCGSHVRTVASSVQSVFQR